MRGEFVEESLSYQDSPEDDGAAGPGSGGRGVAIVIQRSWVGCCLLVNSNNSTFFKFIIS